MRLTPAIVKKSVMDTLLARISEPNQWDFFDLCAGSGQIGYEALSIGFGRVFLSDTDLGTIRFLRNSLREESGSIQLFHKDFIRMTYIICNCRKAVLFIDLPYSDWVGRESPPSKIERFFSNIVWNPKSRLERMIAVIQGPAYYSFSTAMGLSSSPYPLEEKYRKLAGQKITLLDMQLSATEV